MGNMKLRLGMLGSMGLIIGVTTLGAAVLLNGVLHMSLIWTFVIVVPLFLLQWYFGPKMVEYSMGVEQASESQYPRLHQIVKRISRKVDIDPPQLMVAQVEMPNAFAYGNIFSGKKVAVTRGLLNVLEEEEVEAVLGHELGHIKHNDAEVMLFLSILPALFMMLGRTLLWSSFLGGRRRNGAALMLVAFVSMAFYFLLNLCILWFSRLREYYADEFSSRNIPQGSRKLQEALVKINKRMSQMKEQSAKGQLRSRGRTAQGRANSMGLNPMGSGMKALFISDPDLADPEGGASDSELVKRYRDREVSLGQKFFEIFTTHPELSKRLKALDKLRN